MKKIFTATFISTVLLNSCSNDKVLDNNKTEVSDSINNISEVNINDVAYSLHGQWLFEPYLNELKKTRSLLKANNQLNTNEEYGQILIINFDSKKLLSKQPSLDGFTENEGIGDVDLYFNNKIGKFAFEPYENASIHEPFTIIRNNDNTITFDYLKSKKKDNYVKLNNSFEESINEILIAGKYKTNDNQVITFLPNGSIKGLKNFKQYEMIFSYVYMPAKVDNIMNMYTINNEDPLINYQFTHSDNKIILQQIDLDWDEMSDKVRYIGDPIELIQIN